LPIPEAPDQLVLSCLAKDPSERPRRRGDIGANTPIEGFGAPPRVIVLGYYGAPKGD
jgi:hypothetical protein